MRPKRGRPRKSAVSRETEIIFTDIVPDDTTCKFCGAEFLDETDLLVHIEQLHDSENIGFISCSFCTLKMKSLDDYALHLRDKHLLDFKCCKYCSRIFTDGTKLTAHQKKHVFLPKKSEYACSACNELFKDTYNLELHEYAEHRNNGDGVILKECLPHLSAVLNMKASILLQNIENEFIYICHTCKFTTLDLECYILHLQKERCQCYVCDKCCIVNKHRDSMQNHMLKHKECHNYVDEDELTKLCVECYQSIDIHYWKKHVISCKVIKCAQCNIIFKSLHDLSRHQNIEHPLTVTIEKCKYCHREFVGKATLNKHLDKVHKNTFHLYKYHCLICSTRFQHPKKLFGHYYSTHKDLEPYTCKICDEKFRIRKKFTLHIKLKHDGKGFVEFDENYHVFFTDKKSEHPFVPQSIEQANDSNSEPKKDNFKETEKNTSQNIDESSIEQNKKDSNTNLDKNDETVNLNIDSDAMNPTETEIEHAEEVNQVRLKRKRKLKPAEVTQDDSDNEPLIKVKKRVKGKRFMKPSIRNGKTKGRNKFTCKFCLKYCYTYQHYMHHMNLHNKSEVKCIKCSKVFTSMVKLNRHMENDHSKSKLTETLKMILERKKNPVAKAEKTKPKNFRIKMKEVDNGKTEVPATLTKLTDNSVSLQNFIENFTPDSSSIAKDVETHRPVIIETNVSLSLVQSDSIAREPKIKMVKFTPKPTPAKPKLTMPVKFKPCTEHNKASIKLAKQTAENTKFRITMHQNNLVSPDEIWTETDHYEVVVEEEREIDIPEMSQEFTVLDSADESKPKITDHKVIIPKLPEVLDDVRIGHLLPEAPFYKIVKVKDVLKAQEVKKDMEEKVVVPGKKLVTANPLAHLLKNKDIKQINNENKNRCKIINFEAAIAKALIQLESPDVKKKVKKIKNKTEETIEEY